MSALDHPLVQDYLRRLHEQTVRLRVDEGRELEAQIREHLTEALGDSPSEVDVLRTLERLGEPAALVDEAGGGPPPGTGPTLPPERSQGWREAGALVALVAAAVLFWLVPVSVVLWLVGLVLLVTATRWSVTEKVWGALVLGTSPWLVVLAGALAFAVDVQACSTDEAGATTCTGGGGGLTALNVVAIVLTVAWAALYVWTLVHLARSAARARVVDYSAADAQARRAGGQRPASA